MPEGHTIHRIARDQTKSLVGRTIRVSSPQGRFATEAQRLDGSTLTAIEAYGKHLFYEWDTGEVGHVHLGLFGRFRVHPGSEPPAPQGAVRMRMSTGETTIDLSGPTICSLDPPDTRDSVVARLGPDPLRRDGRPDRMIQRISRSTRGIGDLLMDQAVVAGLGNVYRAELLFVLGIHPERPGRGLDEPELHAIWTTSKGMLRQGVRDGRIVTVSREELGVAPGKRIPRREATYVYKRDRCLRCGDAVRTVEIANRTCYYCPTDQPA